ncbi:alpha/beta fold hydrolase [Jannaschia sp. W003]|uniref:alpha/beta fold hydrolase n=1 Tax=Jannaschia sp. W003 TaxID=2867012 RepID=UPI0021A5388F|nr:alpha/beta fold hydrolase [Jannaschia sp. W003]UWQ21297.1 alpha/beta fold hydrolase [Jannaschia sp. W003]
MSEPLVLLPGMMCDARLWAPQVAALEGPAQVLPIDGHDTIPALARAVLEAAPERFALAGLSMGGIVAMEMVAQAPERIARLALLDTFCGAEHPKMAARRERQIERVRAGALEAVMREELMPLYVAPGPGAEAVLETCREMALALGGAVFERQARALQRREDRREVLRGVRCPALVLCGEADAMCPPDRHREMTALIPGAVLELVEGAGHLPTLERPKAVTEAMRRWLAA